AFAEFERRHRGSRRNQYVHFLERLGKILADQLADFLRAQIISVVVRRTQNVSAENDAPFHFRAETFLAGAAVMIEQIFWVFRPMSVANAIKARQVCRSLGRGQDVINSDGIISL